jgi:hypothetical protein
MNKHSPVGQSGSLLERAAALYGLEVPTATAGVARAAPLVAPEPIPQPEAFIQPAPGRSARPDLCPRSVWRGSTARGCGGTASSTRIRRWAPSRRNSGS